MAFLTHHINFGFEYLVVSDFFLSVVKVLYPGYHGPPVTAQMNLDTAQFTPAANSWGTKYPVSDMVPALLAEGEGPPTDADIPPIHMTQQMNQEQDTSSNLNQETLTRSHAKKLQQQVTSLLAEFDNNITENIILPKSSILVIIRFKHQGYDDPQEVEGAYCLENIQRNHAVKLGPHILDHHWASSE
jgi:hypothetical protein